MASSSKDHHHHSAIQEVVDFEFIMESPDGLGSAKSVKIEFDPSKFGRHYHSEGVEEKINEEWQRIRRTNARIFNTPKFRLANASCDERRVELQLGLCDMKGYMTTNLGNQSSYLIAEGKKVRNSGKYLADPVGVVILLETSDHYAIALKRPADAAESAGNIDLPGGFPEPGDCGLALNKVEVVGTPAPEGHGGNNATTSKLNSKDTFDPSKYISLVRNEIFDTVQRQAEQEVNLSSDSVATPILLGAIRNKKTQGRIGLCFYAKCNVTADEVRRRYSMLGLEYNFSTSLLTIPFNQILHTNTNEPSIALGGCLELLSARSIHEKVEAAKPKEPKDDQTPEVYKQQGSRGRRRSVPDASEFEEPFTGTVWTDNMSPYLKGCFDLWRKSKQRKAARERFGGQFRPSGRFQPMS